MGLLQNLLRRILFQQTHLPFIRNAETGIQINRMKIISDHIEAETVDRSNLRSGHQRFLSLKPLVSRILLQTLLQRFPDPFLHLPGRRFGKGRDQQPVHIHRMRLVRDQRHNPLHQHSGLAGTCGRRNQKILLPRIYDLFLVLCP